MLLPPGVNSSAEAHVGGRSASSDVRSPCIATTTLESSYGLERSMGDVGQSDGVRLAKFRIKHDGAGMSGIGSTAPALVPTLRERRQRGQTIADDD